MAINKWDDLEENGAEDVMLMHFLALNKCKKNISIELFSGCQLSMTVVQYCDIMILCVIHDKLCYTAQSVP